MKARKGNIKDNSLTDNINCMTFSESIYVTYGSKKKKVKIKHNMRNIFKLNRLFYLNKIG